MKVRDEHCLRLVASKKTEKGNAMKVAKRSGKASPSNMTPDHSRMIGYAMHDAKPGEIVKIAVRGVIIWAALLFVAGCGSIDNDRFLAAALLMQGQANAMARPVSTGTTICRPLPGGAISCSQL